MRLRLTAAAACLALAGLALVSPSRAGFVRPGPRLVPVRVSSAPVMQVDAPPDVVPDYFKAPAKPMKDPQEKTASGKKYKVMLFNDNANLREFVARALVTACPIGSSDAYEVMQGAHSNGFSLVGIFGQEVAEQCHKGLKSRGLRSKMEEDD